MPDPDPLDVLRYRLDAPGSATPECLDDATLAALAEGVLDPAARAAALPHLATCARCRAVVASVARALSDPAVAKEALRSGRGRSYASWIGLPLAAAAVLALAIGVPRWLEQGPTHRAPPDAVQSPVPISPVGTVATARALRWASVAGVDQYRVTLFDAGGRVVYETRVADTTLSLPDSTALAAGRPYLWKVEARTGWDRWSSSALVQFTIGAEPKR